MHGALAELLLFPIPVSNPGFLASVPQPLAIIDTSASSSTFTFSASATNSLWMVAFNFRKHPLYAVAGNYTTGVSFVNLTGSDSKMQAATNSHYNGIIGVTLTGGTVGGIYDLVVGATMSNSQVVSCTLVIQLKS